MWETPEEKDAFEHIEMAQILRDLSEEEAQMLQALQEAWDDPNHPAKRGSNRL